MPAKQTLLNLQTSSLRYAEFSQFIARFLDDVEKENLDVKKEEILSKRYAKQLNPIAIVAAKTKRQLIRL